MDKTRFSLIMNSVNLAIAECHRRDILEVKHIIYLAKQYGKSHNISDKELTDFLETPLDKMLERLT